MPRSNTHTASPSIFFPFMWRARLALFCSNVLGTFFTLIRLLRQKHADEHFLPCVRIHICLEREQRLRLILRQPESLESQRGKRHGQMNQPTENTGNNMLKLSRDLLKHRNPYIQSSANVCKPLVWPKENKARWIILGNIWQVVFLHCHKGKKIKYTLNNEEELGDSSTTNTSTVLKVYIKKQGNYRRNIISHIWPCCDPDPFWTHFKLKSVYPLSTVIILYKSDLHHLVAFNSLVIFWPPCTPPSACFPLYLQLLGKTLSFVLNTSILTFPCNALRNIFWDVNSDFMSSCKMHLANLYYYY